MGESTPATPASKYFAASVAMIAGAFFFAVGAGLLPIPGGPSNLHGPLWLVLCVGFAFFLAALPSSSSCSVTPMTAATYRPARHFGCARCNI
jgi:hypothetical protein